MKKLIKSGFKTERFTITPKTIEKFDVMENRRQISTSHVAQIHGSIISDKNPLGVLIVNEKNSRWRLIDGNHRIEAVKRFYGYKNINKETSIECIIKIYKNLTDDEEREIYANEAKRKNESHEDRLTLYKNTIIFWKLTQDPIKEFPCKVSIYNQRTSLRFRLILDALSTIKSEMKRGYTPKYLSKDDIIVFARELSFEDFQIMKKFVRIFQNSFGNVGINNPFSRRQGFVPLFDIFYKNFLTTKEDIVLKRFENIIGKSDVLMYLNMQGREAQQMIRNIMVNYINKGKSYSTNKVI